MEKKLISLKLWIYTKFTKNVTKTDLNYWN